MSVCPMSGKFLNHALSNIGKRIFRSTSPSNSEKRIVVDDMIPKETFTSLSYVSYRNRFWTSHLLKSSYSLEDGWVSLKSLQYGVQFTRSLWVSLKGPEGIKQHAVSPKPENLKIA